MSSETWHAAVRRCARQYDVDPRNFRLRDGLVRAEKQDIPLPQAPSANADTTPALMQSRGQPFLQALKQAQPLAFMNAGRTGSARRFGGAGVPAWLPRRLGRG